MPKGTNKESISCFLHRRLHLLLLTKDIVDQPIPEPLQHTTGVLMVFRRPATPVVVRETQLYTLRAHALDLGEHGHGTHARWIGRHNDDLRLRERRVQGLGRVQRAVVGDGVIRQQRHADVGEGVAGGGGVEGLE